MMKRKDPYSIKTLTIVIIVLELLLWGLVGMFYTWIMPSVEGLVLQRPEYIWGNVLLTVLSIVFLIAYFQKNKALLRYAHSTTLDKVSHGISTWMVAVKYVLWRLALFFLILALINPRYGSKEIETKSKGIDIFVALDVSNSMMAEDITPNRLTKAKMAIEQLLNKLHNDRLGIVIFAGDAYLQLPITSDFHAAKIFLDDIKPNMIPLQGTAIGKAIDMCKESFDPKSTNGKAIIVISDGENHEDDAVEAADDEDVTIFTIGVGSVKGAKIPTLNRRRRKDFKRDRKGKIVISKMNRENLKEIAKAGGGKFSLITDNNFGFDPFFKNIKNIEQGVYTTKTYEDYEDRFQIFLLLAFLLILIDTILPSRHIAWDTSKNKSATNG